MWKCPECGREFRRTGQIHYCDEKPATIDEYIVQQDPAQRDNLMLVRQTLRQALPEAEARISWSVPTYWQSHNIQHFAASKQHIGPYPGPEAVAHFQKKSVSTQKGTIRIPYGKIMPERTFWLPAALYGCAAAEDGKAAGQIGLRNHKSRRNCREHAGRPLWHGSRCAVIDPNEILPQGLRRPDFGIHPNRNKTAEAAIQETDCSLCLFCRGSSMEIRAHSGPPAAFRYAATLAAEIAAYCTGGRSRAAQTAAKGTSMNCCFRRQRLYSAPWTTVPQRSSHCPDHLRAGKPCMSSDCGST